jgi:hypothetical protein
MNEKLDDGGIKQRTEMTYDVLIRRPVRGFFAGCWLAGVPALELLADGASPWKD